jgi:hypothetical protein
MAIRILANTVLAMMLTTSALAQSSGGSSSAGGGAGGGTAGGAAAAGVTGTAGVSPSPSAPAVGTPGIPGSTNGAGVPGGPGPGNTAVAPNQPPAPAPAPVIGEARGSAATVSGSTVNSGRNTGQANAAVSAAPPSSQASEFHPEAVVDRALAEAEKEITAMQASELRQLDALFDACTSKGHPIVRQGKCAAATRQYKSSFGKDRAVDRALAELERVVRFQHMFATTGSVSTDHEDKINNRLRGSTTVALAATGQSAQVSLKQKGVARH